MQAPLQAYAKLLHERARQQRALLGAEEVKAAVHDDVAEDAEDDAMADDQADMLQQVKAANRERREKQKKASKEAPAAPLPVVSGRALLLAGQVSRPFGLHDGH